jgi:hypothetical protein
LETFGQTSGGVRQETRAKRVARANLTVFFSQIILENIGHF